MEGVAAPSEAVRELVRRALDEDRAAEDATTLAVVPPSARAEARVLARAEGVLAGMPWALASFRELDPAVGVLHALEDGSELAPGDEVLRLGGSARALLAAERVALNFLQQLSGVATLTRRAVAAAGGRLQVLPTRKTVPGLRDAQRHAVRAGGGVDHRRDLADQLLLKENHFALSGLSYAETVARAVAAAAGRVVGAEARSVEEADAALSAGADYVLLDNFTPEGLAAAVAELRTRHPRAVLEASGGLHPDDLVRLAGLGLDRVSLGALTHSPPALDLSLLLEPRGDAA